MLRVGHLASPTGGSACGPLPRLGKQRLHPARTRGLNALGGEMLSPAKVQKGECTPIRLRQGLRASPRPATPTSCVKGTVVAGPVAIRREALQ